jgi:putative serine/threonine protein kinase
LSQQNVSYSAEEKEIDIRSPSLVPLITYPDFSELEHKDRINEMESLGITSIILGGKTVVNGVHIAGKGSVGIVVKSKAGSKICALKIRRTDASRKTMNEEVRFHKIANSVEVGPHLEGQTKNLIAMEYIPGQYIIDWVLDSINININNINNNNNNIENNNDTQRRICTVTKAILEQCFSLDVAGLDHGQLSRLTRHVIVSDNSPCIIDFESASIARKTSNVTAAVQSIFLYGIVANNVRKIFGNIDKERVLYALRTYKHFQTRANFDAILYSLSI